MTTIEEFSVAMKRPEGTVMLGGTYPGIHAAPADPDIVAQVIAGAHVFRIVRGPQAGQLTASHGSPGGGTWVATVDLAAVAPQESLHLWLAWSPEVLRLIVVDRDQPGRMVSAEGKSSDVRLWVDRDGNVVTIGSPGVRVMGATVYSGGARVVSPPALELWTQTVEAVRVLLTGESPEGYIYEAVAASAALVVLVTGFETYSEQRFIELDEEGVPCDALKILGRFGVAEERQQLEAGQTPKSIADTLERGESPVRAVAERVSFQNYRACKRAFNVGYGLKFGEDLGLSSQLLERVQKLITYRHLVVHVSPLPSMLNPTEVPPEAPEFPNTAFAESALSTMDEFIQGLHRATLRLRPPQKG